MAMSGGCWYTAISFDPRDFTNFLRLLHDFKYVQAESDLYLPVFTDMDPVDKGLNNLAFV